MDVIDVAKSNMKICIVTSCGGHLTEVRQLKTAYENFDHFYVINDKIKLPLDMEGKTFFIKHSERDLLFFVNLWEAFVILRNTRPQVIVSTGAGPIVPFALVGRYLFGIKIIFIETITRLNAPSLTGRIMYRLAHHFYFQWESLRPFFSKGTCVGPLL